MKPLPNKKPKAPNAQKLDDKRIRMPSGKTVKKSPARDKTVNALWQPANIYEALLAVQKERLSVPRNGRGKAQNGDEYKYATLDDTFSVAMPVLQKYGVGLTQIVMQSKLQTKLFHAASGTEITSEMDLAKPSSMQSYGANVTYAKRYAFTAMIGLSTDEDTDAVPAEVPDVAPKDEVKVETPEAQTLIDNEVKAADTRKLRSEPFTKAEDMIKSTYSAEALELISTRIKASERLTDAEKAELIELSKKRETEVEGTEHR